MGLSRRIFTKEFKLAAVQRLEQGISIGEPARRLRSARMCCIVADGVSQRRGHRVSGFSNGASKAESRTIVPPPASPTRAPMPGCRRPSSPTKLIPSMARLGQVMEGRWVVKDRHNFGPDYDKTPMLGDRISTARGHAARRTTMT